ncbi:MAG: hypothetical protein M1822_001412 [Bathelium mastoideum]|nr:MAG: hypothetical protein M1822_001412 [Bathelium mastoideum]
MREEEPLNCCAFIGLSFRMAQMLGLHRDPQHFKSLDPISAEVRRRIWWHVVHLDVSIAVASGLPPIIDLHCWDVQKPTELKDEAIGTPDGLQYDRSVAAGNRVRDSADDPEDVNGHSMVSTGGVLAGGKFSSTYLMRKALSKLCARTSPSVEDQSDMRAWFRNMSEDLAARIERIPQGPSNRRSGSVRQPDDVIEYRMRLNKWARLLLSGFIDRNWIICHPILKTSLQQGLPNVYEQGLNHCIMFLKKATHLACIPDFRHFQWSWPGIHQPVQPLTIVLQDLIERPVSPIAELARRYIDIAFVLLRPSEGLRGGEEDASMPRPPSEGSAETWEYLGRLRSTAWSNAGIDPSMFCTWQAATAYCLLDQEVGDGAASVSTSTGFSESLLDPAIFPTDTMVAGQDFTNEISGFGSMDMYPARWYDGLNELNVDAVGIGLQ